MSGHSHFANIKNQKGLADAKRGQVFSKLAREIIVAVRQGGPNPDANFRLRLAIQKGRDVDMPTENIQRAIKRGSGDTEGAVLQEMVLEGYGPNGVAIMIQALSDNRNRTIQEVRNVFTRGGGNMAASGAVSWLFDSRGVISLQPGNIDKDEVALAAIDNGADDVKVEDGYVEIYTKPEDMEKVRKALEGKNIPINASEVTLVPKTTVELTDEKSAGQALRLLDKLEELDDVQAVTSNANFPDEILEKIKV